MNLVGMRQSTNIERARPIEAFDIISAYANRQDGLRDQNHWYKWGDEPPEAELYGIEPVGSKGKMPDRGTVEKEAFIRLIMSQLGINDRNLIDQVYSPDELDYMMKSIKSLSKVSR